MSSTHFQHIRERQDHLITLMDPLWCATEHPFQGGPPRTHISCFDGHQTSQHVHQQAQVKQNPLGDRCILGCLRLWIFKLQFLCLEDSWSGTNTCRNIAVVLKLTILQRPHALGLTCLTLQSPTGIWWGHSFRARSPFLPQNKPSPRDCIIKESPEANHVNSFLITTCGVRTWCRVLRKAHNIWFCWIIFVSSCTVCPREQKTGFITPCKNIWWCHWRKHPDTAQTVIVVINNYHEYSALSNSSESSICITR